MQSWDNEPHYCQDCAGWEKNAKELAAEVDRLQGVERELQEVGKELVDEEAEVERLKELNKKRDELWPEMVAAVTLLRFKVDLSRTIELSFDVDALLARAKEVT